MRGMSSVAGTVASSVNYATTTTSQTVTKVATNPSAVKKVLQIATKVFAAMDYYHFGKTQDRKVTDAMKGSIELIEFYGAFRDVMFWINPFSKETMDEKALLESLTSTLCDPVLNDKVKKENKQLATTVFHEVMRENAYYSKDEVREAIIKKLENNHYTHQAAVSIANKLIIQQKARPITLLFSMACFTTVDLLGTALTLKKWGIADLTVIAAQIGGQSRVFAFVMQFSVETVFGTIASAALIVTFSEATYRAVIQGIKIYQEANPKDKEQAWKELRLAILDMLASGTDLINAAAPLLFTLNPPAIIALAIVAKGTGLICIIVK